MAVPAPGPRRGRAAVALRRRRFRAAAGIGLLATLGGVGLAVTWASSASPAAGPAARADAPLPPVARAAPGGAGSVAAADPPAGAKVGSGPFDELPRGGLPAGGPAGTVVASPAPGTRTASVSTQISLLGRAALSLGPDQISVVGSVSGAHAGTLRAYSTDNGESFLPARPFVAGERVTVTTQLDVAGAASGTWSFRVGDRLTVSGHQPLPPLSTSASGTEHFASAPGIEPPSLTGTGSPGGDVFSTPKGSVGQAGPMITGPGGNLVWFDPLQGEEAFDLDVQQLGSKPVLTWFQGVVADAHGVGEDVVADRHYRTIAVLDGANGFQPDLHEFQLLPDGIALITSYQALRWDLAPAGGPRAGLAWDGIAQEIDVRTGLVEYEWHSLDHVGVSLSDIPAPSRPGHVWDYFHINSLQQLSNGDLLVGARNTSAAYEVSPERGGAVVWELGGRRSSFTMGAGTSFWLQHDVELPAPGVVTIFDDEASPAREKPAQSRALVERLDYASMTASLVRADTHTPAELGGALGNVQSLPGGRVFVGWGTTPYISEYAPGGAVVFDSHLPTGDDTYRAYLYPWSGRPLTKPSVAFVPAPDHATGLAMSWNGATAVARWRVIAGSSTLSLHVVATVPESGFQTTVTLPAGTRAARAVALSASGAVLAGSRLARTG